MDVRWVPGGGLNYPSRRRTRGNLNFTTLTADTADGEQTDRERRVARQKDRGRERESEE